MVFYDRSPKFQPSQVNLGHVIMIWVLGNWLSQWLQRPTVTRLPFAAFPAGSPQAKSVGWPGAHLINPPGSLFSCCTVGAPPPALLCSGASSLPHRNSPPFPEALWCFLLNDRPVCLGVMTTTGAAGIVVTQQCGHVTPRFRPHCFARAILVPLCHNPRTTCSPDLLPQGIARF